MKINHKLINKSALAREIGMNEFVFNNKLRNDSFSDFELLKIKDKLEDMTCYIFECDEIKCIKL